LSVSSAVVAEERRVVRLQHLPVAEIHVDAAWEAWIEAPNRAHDVDPLEALRAVLLEDRRILYRVLVGAWRPVHVAYAAVPRRRRIRVIVGDLALPDHDVMRQHAAHRPVEAAGDRFVR